MADESFRYDILINAKEAIRELREMSKAAADNNQRVVEFSSFLIEKSKQWNVPIKQLLNTFKQLNAEMAKAKGQSIFGNVGGKNIFNMSENFLQSAQAAGRFQTTSDGVVKSVKNVGNAMEETDKKGRGWKHGIDLVRTALGTLTAVGIFQFLSFLTESFQTAVKAARELEDSLFRLGNVEKILSEGGIEISLEGLKDGIQEIKDLFPIFSQEDVTQLVAQIAISTKELGLTEQQIIDLAKAVAVLNIRSTEEETASQTAQKIISAMITDNARGISSLGLSFKEMELQAKAVSMGFLSAGESAEKLTSEEKAQVKYAIILENTSDELSNVGEYLDTNTAKIKENSASWHDLLTTIGSLFSGLTPAIGEILEAANQAVNGMKLFLAITISMVEAFSVLGQRVKQIFGAITFELNPAKKIEILKDGFRGAIEEFNTGLQEGIGERVKKFFPEVPANMSSQFQDIIKSYLGEIEDTPTAIQNFQNALDSIDTEKAQDAINDMIKKLQDLQKKMNESEQDFSLKLGRFDEDTLREREDMVEDYNLNVLQTQRAFALRRKEMEDKYRQREIQDERKFQEQLRQLREKFLYNLEDALRERDARQVLRLTDQYNMERQAMINENNLRRQEQEEQRQQERNDLRAEEEERLRVMAEEFNLKMQRYDEEQAIKRQRMEEDHAIEMARMQEQQAEIIAAAAQKIAEEYGLNAEGAEALLGLLNQYYGSSGALAAVTAQGYGAMLNQASTFLAQTAAIIAQYQGMMAGAAASISPYSSPGGGYIPGGYSSSQNTTPMGGRIIPGYAEGGQFVATKPKIIAVGEGGEPELVTVTPLSQINAARSGIQPVNGADGLNGRNGESRIVLDMNLSPDLEARVAERSMNSTAKIVQKINRTKR